MWYARRLQQLNLRAASVLVLGGLALWLRCNRPAELFARG